MHAYYNPYQNAVVINYDAKTPSKDCYLFTLWDYLAMLTLILIRLSK